MSKQLILNGNWTIVNARVSTYRLMSTNFQIVFKGTGSQNALHTLKSRSYRNDCWNSSFIVGKICIKITGQRLFGVRGRKLLVSWFLSYSQLWEVGTAGGIVVCCAMRSHGRWLLAGEELFYLFSDKQSLQGTMRIPIRQTYAIQ